MIIYLLVFAVIIFMLWTTYSQQRRAKRAQEDLQRMLKKGDEVVTAGGMFGTVRKVGDDFVVLEVADRIRVRFLKRAIREIVSEEEYDEDEEADEEYVDDEGYEEEYDEDAEASDEDEEEEEAGDEEPRELTAGEADEADESVDEAVDEVEAPKPPTPPKGS
ncbi:MAG TPA: preprotein translocase subunit YajC [Thermoleophilia bacterium]|nr:preprotein translocase subunit YajC [Thermoleophilia bacterium]